MDASTAPTKAGEEAAKTELELLKLRYDFAWKHFDFHAKQRTTMFQYFVTILPLIVGGYFYFLQNKNMIPRIGLALAAISLMGLVITLAFWMFDIRNRQLYGISQENLKLLEKHYLYATTLASFRGIITEEEARYNKCRHYFVKFKFWMPVIFFVSTGLFFALGFCAVATHLHWFGWTFASSTPP